MALLRLNLVNTKKVGKTSTQTVGCSPEGADEVQRNPFSSAVSIVETPDSLSFAHPTLSCTKSMGSYKS